MGDTTTIKSETVKPTFANIILMVEDSITKNRVSDELLGALVDLPRFSDAGLTVDETRAWRDKIIHNDDINPKNITDETFMNGFPQYLWGCVVLRAFLKHFIPVDVNQPGLSELIDSFQGLLVAPDSEQ